MRRSARAETSLPISNPSSKADAPAGFAHCLNHMSLKVPCSVMTAAAQGAVLERRA